MIKWTSQCDGCQADWIVRKEEVGKGERRKREKGREGVAGRRKGKKKKERKNGVGGGKER